MQIERTAVVVIGGGPAGACYAAVAARAGLSVRVLEGTAFPRHHIGESLLAMSMPLLKTVGVLPALDRAGFLDKTGAIFVWGERHARIDLTFPSPGRAFQVRRAEFDQILLQHATECGARVAGQQWVKKLIRADDGRITGVISDGADGPATHRCSLLVDASGLFRFLPRKLGLDTDVRGPQRVAISAYFNGAGRVDGPQHDNIISEASRDGWLWFIPLDDNTTSIGFVGDARDLAGSPAEHLAAQIDSSQLVRSLVAPAKMTADVRLLRYTNHISASPMWQSGYLLVGDSAMFVDPLFSTGVHGALYSAVSAAAASVSLLQDGFAEAELASWYDARMRSHYERVDAMVSLLYGINGGMSRFWADRSLQGMTAETARELSRGLGPISVPLFRAGFEQQTLDIPPALARELDRFVSSVNPRTAVSADAVQLSDGVAAETGLVRQGDRLVRSWDLCHRDGVAPPVTVPVDSAEGLLVQQLATGPVQLRDWQDTARSSAFISVLFSAGLVTAAAPRSSELVS